MTETLSPLLNQEEAAKLLGISPTTLATWRCTKRYPLDYVKVGRAVRYKLASILAFTAERTVDTAGSLDPTAARR